MTSITVVDAAPIQQPDEQRRLRRARLAGMAWIVIWMAMTVPLVRQGWELGGSKGWIGAGCAIVACASLSTVWFRSFGLVREGHCWPDPVGWACLVTGVLVTAVGLVTLGAPAVQMVVFVGVAVAFAVPWQWSLGVELLLAAGTWFAQDLVPAWGATHGTALGVLGSGIGCLLGRVASERGQVARAMTAHAHQLEIAEERNRMARDLHDILGHSLTVITLKTELAAKLVDVDPAAAKEQLAEVQQISRSALADVRSTVNNYREMSLAGEIARAANTLASAGVKADLPTVVDDVDPELRELFAWALREGVTNVVRHAHATHCVVTVGPASLVVEDDGVGIGGDSDGHGLEGLRARCEAAGVSLRLGVGLHGKGTELRVTRTDA